MYLEIWLTLKVVWLINAERARDNRILLLLEDRGSSQSLGCDVNGQRCLCHDLQAIHLARTSELLHADQ